MNSIALFLGLCIPSRLFIAWLSTRLPLYLMPFFATALLLVALAFFYLYFSNSRLQAPEANGTTWWASYRLLIGALWFTAAIYAFQRRRDLVWIPLVMDVALGLAIFYQRHFG